MLLVAMLLFLEAGTCIGQSVSWGKDVRFNFRGSAGSDVRYFPEDPLAADQPAAQDAYGVEAEFDLSLPHALDLRLHPRLRMDGREPRKSPVVMDDAYLGQYGEHFEWRLGYQVFSWKVVESYSQADVLNQSDRRLDLLNPEKLGEPAGYLLLKLPSWLGQSLEGYYLPYFTPAPLPAANSRYSPVTGSPFRIESDEDESGYDSPSKRWEPQGALRYTAQLSGFDIALYYFHGYHRFPQLVPDPAHPGMLAPLYDRIDQGGLTFQGALGNWILKGESAYQGFAGDVRGMSGRPVDPYWSFTTGCEYTFYAPFHQDQDLIAALEWIGDTDAGKQQADLEGFRPFQHDIFAGFRYVFGGISDATLSSGLYWDYQSQDLFYKLQVQRRFLTSLSLNAGYNGIRLGDDEADNRFRFLERSSSLFMGLKYYW